MKKGFKFLVKLNIFLALSFSAFFAIRASFAEESIENTVAEEQMSSNSSLQETTRTDEVVYVVEGYEAEGTKKTNDEIFELISQNGYTLIQNISSINAGDEVKDVISLKDENNNPVAYDLLTNVTDTTNVSSIDMYFSFIDTKVSYETTETEHVTVTTNTKYIFKETISVNEISTNIESNVIYSLGKEITFENAVAELDNISITSGTAVSTAGEHTLVLKNINGTIISEIKFAVNNLAVDQIDEKEVAISTADLIDNETYYNKVSFTYTPIENAIYTLDGENLTNDVEKDTQGNIVNNVANLVVSKTGAHSFKISYNGKEYTYSFYVFTIENYSEFNAEQYNSSNFPTTINFTSGTGYTVYLNGKETTGTLNITSFGNQIIEVKNGNELIDRVSFVVDPIVTIGTKTINLENGTAVSRTTDTLGNEVVTELAYSTNDKLLQFDKETTFKYTLNAVSFTRNGKKVSNDSSTNNPGRNVLVLKGINGYSTNIMFFINPKTNLKDNYTYKGQVLPTSTGGTLKLNGDSFVSGTTVNTSGKYKFDIYGDYNNLTLVKTYTFDIYPEILNVSSQDKSKPQIFTSSVIPAKTNNKMYYTFNDGEKIDYTSGKALYEVGSYTFYLENVDNTASTGVKTSTYYFEIKQEIATEVSDNIIEGEEFFDEFQVLFTGKQNAYIIYDDAVINEGKVQSGTTKLISNGDILTTIGVYYISYDYVSGSDVNNATWKSFKISPTLNVEDSHAYLSNQDIKLFNENKTFSTDGLNLYLTSEHGTKATSNLTKDELQSLETPNVLSSGTYSLKITGTNNYEKVINFIIIDSNKVNVGSRYINGTSFDFDMYGVTVYVNAPQTRKNITDIQLTNTYEYDSPTKTAESIKTVGKHYFTYSFKLNDYLADTRKYIVTDSPTFVAGVKYYKLIDGKYIEQTVEDGAQISTNEIYYVEANTDSAIYFYITPVIKYNGAAKDSYTTTNVNYSSINLGTSKESVTISMKDGFGQDYIEYEMDAQSKDFAFNVEYNKIGNHYITIILGDISIKASFTVATDIIITDGNELLVDSTIFKEYTNLITTTKAYLVLDNKFAKYENIDDSIDIYGKDIISVGNHTITIVGTNNYSVTKNFIIKEIIEYTGQSKNGQITSEEAISTFTDKNLVIENTIYYSSNEEFTINLYGKSVIVNSTINGEDVDLTTSITKTKIGNYTLKITGVSYSAVYYFIIKDNLKINDKAPVDTYTETVKVSLVNDIEITSNVDATFNRENTIKTVGHYELIVKGVGAYEKKYTFDILNNVLMSQDKVEFEGISSKTIYDVYYFKKQYDATDFKTIMVNGTEGLVASVSTVGKYNIVATNANDEEVINVTIFLSESLLFNETGKANASKIYETLVATYVKNENSNVKLGTVTVSNEQTLDSIKTLGKTIITIKGEGSYTNSYTVFIKETVTPSLFTSEATATLEANKIEYKDALGYTFNTNDIVYKSVKLDDKDYTNGSKVDQYGLHTIVVTGVDYTNTYYVFIKLSNYVITEDSSTGAKTISNVNAPMFINEEKVAATFENDSYTFNYVDEYTLKFTGNKAQTVTDKVVVEPIIGFENGSVYYHAITPTLTLNPNLNRNGKIVIATDEVSPVVIGSYTNIDDIKMVNEIGKYTFTITTYLGSSRIYNKTYKFEIHPTINYVSSDITDITVNSLGYENKVEVIVKDDNTLNASIDYSNANVKINGSTLTVKDNVINNINKIVDTVGYNTLIISQNGYLFKETILIKEVQETSETTTILLPKTEEDAKKESNVVESYIPNFDVLQNDVYIDGSTTKYDGTTPITTFGLHKIVVKNVLDKGVGDYESEPYYIYIGLKDVQSGTFTEPQNLVTNAKTLKIESASGKYSKEYTNLEGNNTADINVIGDYIVTLIGVNGETIVRNITLDAELEYNGNDLISTATLRNDNTKYVTQTSGVTLKKQANSTTDFKSITLNGNPIYTDINSNAGYTFNTIGNNKLAYSDIDGNVYTYDIIITEDEAVHLLVDGEYKPLQTTKASAEIIDYTSAKYVLDDKLKASSILLDGEAYNSTNISMFGLHDLTINGVNGYSKTYYTNIKFNNNIAKNYTEAVTLKDLVNVLSENPEDTSNFVNGKIVSVTSGNNTYGKTLDTVGTYTVVVNGYNGATETFDINLINNVVFKDLNNNVVEDSYTNVVKAVSANSLKYKSVKLNGSTYVFGSTINSLGKNKLVLTSTDGTETSQIITLTETLVNPVAYSTESQARETANRLNENDLIEVSFGQDLSYNMTLDGASYNGSDINGYGLHHVVLTGQDYTKDYYVMVNPYYEAKINETDGSIILTHNGKLTIGETDYSNVNALDTIGNYKNIKLTSNVSNDYVMEDDIVLDGILLGFENANTYNTSITPRLSLKASAIKVNGEIVDSLGSYNTVGSYTLEISGVNGYSKEYTFKLENEILADNNKLVNSYTSASIVSLSETGTVKYASYKLNNLSKDTLVSSVNSLGTNNLVVKDINGNETTYTIEITDESIRNSKLFDTRALALSNQLASLSLDKNNIDCTITVDGKPYNGEINTYGVHTVILSNENTGYTKSYSSFVELFSTIKEDAIYVNSTPTISLNSNYQIDGVSSNETKIYSIGHHTITALGEGDVSTDIKFTVKEDLSGIEDNGIYTDKVTINISNIGSAAVGFDNGIMLANGASFSKIGKYTLQISGANDYTSSYSFTIKENEPIWNNKIYNISYTFNENDVEGLLIDDKKYSATFELVTVGYHNVRILGVGGYQSDEYKLTIKEDARNIINEQLNTYEHKTYGMQNFYDHQNEVTIAIPNAKIKLNNNLTEDTKVTLIGYYKLTVLGTNGYSNDYYFDIRYKLDGVEDRGTYIGSTSASADNVVMTLDGKIYTKGTPITSVGDHTLSVSGDGETTHFDYKFTIYPDFKDNEIINDYKIDTKVEYTSARSFNVQEGSGLLMEISDIDSLGNTSYKSYENGTVIDEIGEYTINVYNPETGFKKTYSFEISADVEDIESEYTTSVTPVIKNKEVIKDITLNDEKYTIGTKIDFVGSYTLRINGKNNYQKVYNFTIKEDLNYITADISTVNKAVENYKKLDGDITSYSAVNIINNDESIKFNVTLNGKEITATNKFETINTLGYNKVIITGENGYRNEYNITLLETLNFEDNVIKEENSFIPSFGSLVSTGIVLDGAEYMGARVSGYGKHTITINGVNGYNKSYSINIPLVTEMHDKACYNSNVELSFNSNNIMVDNTSLENGSVLNSIGNHTVVVSGYGDISKTFNITILPELVGFKPDASYKSSDNIKASFKDSKAVSLALDGNNYQENTPITSYGTHTLVLTGTNDYKMVYEFKIELDTNIIDAALAFEFMPEANAKFSVDTTEWINGKPVEEVGNHTITYYGIVDADTVVKSITVEAQVNFENNSEVIGQVQLRIKNASKVLLNNNEVDANDIIDTIGANIITVVGTNSYTKDFNITITPQIKKIESLREDGRGINYIYQIIDKNNETTQTYLSFTIDGIDATNGGDYTRIGNHKVVIKGANNYVFEDEFTVEAQANVTEDAVYNTKTIVNMMDAQSMTIDGKTMTGDTVVANGKHVLVVTGDNGYVCEITFIYNNPHYLFVLIYVVVTLVIVLSAFAGRKIHKRRLIENGYVRKR